MSLSQQSQSEMSILRLSLRWMSRDRANFRVCLNPVDTTGSVKSFRGSFTQMTVIESLIDGVSLQLRIWIHAAKNNKSGWPELSRRLDPYFEKLNLTAIKLWF
jgi:hypothetical protein